jgi:hypothetical protein
MKRFFVHEKMHEYLVLNKEVDAGQMSMFFLKLHLQCGKKAWMTHLALLMFRW